MRTLVDAWSGRRPDSVSTISLRDDRLRASSEQARHPQRRSARAAGQEAARYPIYDFPTSQCQTARLLINISKPTLRRPVEVSAGPLFVLFSVPRNEGGGAPTRRFGSP